MLASAHSGSTPRHTKIPKGWYRLGVALSFLWVVVVFIAMRISDVSGADRQFSSTYRLCSSGLDRARSLPRPKDALPPSYDYTECQKDAATARILALEGSWSNEAFVAIAPVPVFWFFTWLIVVVVKWIRRGFNAPESA